LLISFKAANLFTEFVDNKLIYKTEIVDYKFLLVKKFKSHKALQASKVTISDGL